MLNRWVIRMMLFKSGLCFWMIRTKVDILTDIAVFKKRRSILSQYSLRGQISYLRNLANKYSVNEQTLQKFFDALYPPKRVKFKEGDNVKVHMYGLKSLFSKKPIKEGLELNIKRICENGDVEVNRTGNNRWENNARISKRQLSKLKKVKTSTVPDFFLEFDTFTKTDFIQHFAKVLVNNNYQTIRKISPVS
eukprot:UN25403